MGHPRCISKHHFSIAFLSHQARTHAREARPRELRPASSCLIRLCISLPRTSGRPSSCKLHPRQPLLHTPTSPARPRHTPPHSASPRSPIGSDAALPTYGLLRGFCPSRKLLHSSADSTRRPIISPSEPSEARGRPSNARRASRDLLQVATRRDDGRPRDPARRTPWAGARPRAGAVPRPPVRPLKPLSSPSQTLSNPLKPSQALSRLPTPPPPTDATFVHLPRGISPHLTASHRISPRTRTRSVGGIKA